MSDSIFRSPDEHFPQLVEAGALFYTLDGKLPKGESIQEPLEEEGYVRGCRIVLTGRYPESETSHLISLLTDERNYKPDPAANGARCFYPGFGFQFGAGPTAVQVLICLECWWVVFWSSRCDTWVVANGELLRKLGAIYTGLK